MTHDPFTDTDPVLSAMSQRFSCRAFLDREVPEQITRKILNAAQRTASWCNVQPWEVVIVSGEARQRLTRALLRSTSEGSGGFDIPAPQTYEGEYRSRRNACAGALYSAVGVARGDTSGRERQRLENFRFFGAPHVAIILNERALGPYAHVDCGGYIANFLLAAASTGVDTVAQAAIAAHSAAVREQLGIASDKEVLCAISFGYADHRHPANSFRTERADISTAVRWHSD